MATNMKWPLEVPILTGKDICRYELEKGEQRCLWGWMGKALSREKIVWGTPPETAVKALAKACGTADIIGFNNNPNRPLGTIARAWNRAMADLGYTVGNPEAGWRKKAKKS